MASSAGTKLALLVVTSGLMFGIAEAVVRVLGIAPGFGAVQFGQHAASEDLILGWQNAANVNGMNSLGLRGPEPREPKRGTRILCLGDSVAFGFNLNDDQTIARRLEVALGALGVDAEVLNAGVIAYNSRQEGRWLELNGDRLAPDTVVVIYCLNDTTDLGAEALPEDLFRKANQENKTDDWARQRNLRKISPALNSLLTNCHLARVIYYALSKPDKLTVKGNKQLMDSGWSKDFSVVEDGFARIAKYAASKGIPATIVIMPFIESLENYPHREQHQKVTAIAKKNGLEVLDLLPVFATHFAANKRPLALPGDPVHPNAEGAEVAAQAIARALRPK